jgi:hypothetical protein
MVCRRFVNPASAFVRKDTKDGSGFGRKIYVVYCLRILFAAAAAVGSHVARGLGKT